MPPIFRKAEPLVASDTSPSTTAPASNREVTVNIIFGVFTVILGCITLWQGYWLWRTLRQDSRRNQDQSSNGISNKFVRAWSDG